MSVKDLHAITGKLIEQGRGDAEVAFNTATVIENEDPNATIHTVEKGKYRLIRGHDDSVTVEFYVERRPLRALKNHLEDMRRIVFAKLETPRPGQTHADS